MLTLSNVSYSYKKGKKSPANCVLENISGDFHPGTFYTIFGPSGSGKTTCLSLLGGLDVPTEGEVLLDGKNIKEIGYNYLRKVHISYIFQDFHLFTYMTAIENVMIAMNISGVSKNKKEAQIKSMELLLALGLDEKDLFRVVTKLSGGQQQRVAIARAISSNATYILADEPTGNLDSKNTDNIISILKDLVHVHNKCVITVTHSNKIKEASDVCYEIDNGKFQEK